MVADVFFVPILLTQQNSSCYGKRQSLDVTIVHVPSYEMVNELPTDLFMFMFLHFLFITYIKVLGLNEQYPKTDLSPSVVDCTVPGTLSTVNSSHALD